MTQSRFRLYDAAGVDVLIEGMARQAYGLLAGRPLTLVGVLRRGAPLAERLAQRLHALDPALDIQRTDLHVKRYSDDLRLLHPETRLDATPEQAAADFSGRVLLVVDDVLYQGHSLMRVFEYLRGRHAEAVYAAVLVDREAARWPVRAQVVGATLRIAPDDVIECSVPPFEAEWAITLCRQSGAP
ncbi:phosphoribosyltransferase family protein [Rehaibacterium terrae]|jgi:pyrimidine operon attenuation protein/uracil phosphoribosyltransferase|uniref:Pyrimidine operon attenuation protein/uracil phosphoribosyltransferase n=1 Tax=Rehaibacterium terrae TaxID=1341696 RepID=A0A7W7Y1H3_9GAMM|nr:phosphoribosyltransferase family protein [Rehaibacterium terrae]MBB5016377.1 pyrimidine operon attenuation protein/uracil phosphoribosyltransferase [Rehaibacterium terrae]